MNNFEYLKSLTLDEFTEWLDKYGQFDGAPWSDWFNETYCKKCEPIDCQSLDPAFEGYKMKCAYCELEGNCKYFKDLLEAPDNKKILELWLLTNKE